MNPWKVSFFLLAGLVLAGVVYLFSVMAAVSDSDPLPTTKPNTEMYNALTVRTTKSDFEGIANTYIYRAMDKDAMAIDLAIEDEVVISSELEVFSYRLPVKMYFNPIVLEDGNLMLKQSSLEIGKLNLPPSTVLKVLKDSEQLPPWMVVRPKEEEIFINLNDLPISGDIKVKAKEIDLEQDDILLEIFIPEE